MRAAPEGKNSSGYVFVIADDHPLFRGALRHAVADAFGAVTIEEAGSLDEVTHAVTRHDEVDIVLLDLAMPGVRGFSGLMFLRAQYPQIPVIMISGSEEPAVIRRSIDLGASGFIPKSMEINAISAAIAHVLEGGIWLPDHIDLEGGEEDDSQRDLAKRLSTLTPQQVRVLMMLSEGLLNKQIAYELRVSEATVKAHVSAILQKLNVDSRTQAVIAAARIESGQWQALGM
ncbi:MAG: response regulator transcription factor [Hyphomicrobiales bacterium]|nr:response regulator transcription factor [Hyphomicrobiales bacterium]